jgi:pimeloyl-ACP methyl ester carboxylesterase
LAVDLFLPPVEDDSPIPVIIYCHGFKGFKNWGFIPYLHEYFSAGNFAFIAFNYARNGVVGNDDIVTQNQLFAGNTVTSELNSMKAVGDWLKENAQQFNLDREHVTWLGHSRGGANVIVFANLYPNYVEKIVAWNPIPSYQWLFKDVDKEHWKNQKSISITNARTGQVLSLDYGVWADILANEEEYDVLENTRTLGRPLLIVHGEQDDVVPPELSLPLYEACVHSLRMTVPTANHTFNVGHPCAGIEAFTTELWIALDNTMSYIEEL